MSWKYWEENTFEPRNIKSLAYFEVQGGKISQYFGNVRTKKAFQIFLERVTLAYISEKKKKFQEREIARDTGINFEKRNQ